MTNTTTVHSVSFPPRSPFGQARVISIHGPAGMSKEIAARAALEHLVAEGAPIDGFILSGLDLDGAELRGASFRNCDLSTSSFRLADLRGAVFEDCVLDQIQAQGVNLQGAKLHQCSLRSANLSLADLTDAVISGGSLGMLVGAAGVEGAGGHMAVLPQQDRSPRTNLSGIAGDGLTIHGVSYAAQANWVEAEIVFTRLLNLGPAAQRVVDAALTDTFDRQTCLAYQGLFQPGVTLSEDERRDAARQHAQRVMDAA